MFGDLGSMYGSHNNDDVIFINRPPHIFKHVLAYLIDPKYDYPKKYESELKYFLMEDDTLKQNDLCIKNNAPKRSDICRTCKSTTLLCQHNCMRNNCIKCCVNCKKCHGNAVCEHLLIKRRCKECKIIVSFYF